MAELRDVDFDAGRTARLLCSPARSPRHLAPTPLLCPRMRVVDYDANRTAPLLCSPASNHCTHFRLWVCCCRRVWWTTTPTALPRTRGHPTPLSSLVSAAG